jgi:uncharacterized repeat protein (TIGR01451 family)
VTINQAAGQADPTNASPINFTVVFDEPVTGFADADVNLSGTAGATTANVTEVAPNNDTTYNVAVSGMTTSGTVIATIPAGAAQDAAGNTSNASTSTDNTVTYIAATSDLTIAKSHNGDFTQGQIGAQYTITVSNAGDGPTSGTVTMVDTLPAGLTATAISGTGWTCDLGTLTCTRSNALAAGTSYPDITLTVDVAANAPASVTNTATVSGGGETNTGNDSANDQTTINPPARIDTTTSITSDTPDPSTVGQAVTVQYTVAPTAGSGTPTGNVTVSDGVDSCSAAVAAGQCTITLTTAGTRTLTASYQGDSTFNGSTSADEAHTVSAASQTPTVTVVVGGQCITDISGQINLLLADTDTPPAALTLTATSSKTVVLPDANIVFGGSGANRTMTVTGTRSGIAKVTITVSDGSFSSTTIVSVFVGTSGVDTRKGAAGPDIIFGMDGNDILDGQGSADLICGGAGDDKLEGSGGNDTIEGGIGNDTISGGDGDDIMRGGDDNDSLTGRTGADLFSGGPGSDTAVDFNAGQGDTSDGTIP